MVIDSDRNLIRDNKGKEIRQALVKHNLCKYTLYFIYNTYSLSLSNWNVW